MEHKEIRLVIDSDLKNVSLVGRAINALCPLIARSRISASEIELCVVEAVNNCIEHAYGKEKGHEIEVCFTLHQDRLVIDVYDTGKSMDLKRLNQTDLSALEMDSDQINTIAEKGRGLAIIKEIMDVVAYETENGKNCLSLTKNFDS
jgi:anti-sigma regulatory factor (Ser/Thr protein kinase)